jgi:hypothetical protein
VPFTDFLKATVLLSAAAASALGAVTVAAATRDGQDGLVLASACWWVLAAAFGLWIGRRAQPNPGIARLLATARATATLPELRPGRMLLNRLWPLVVLTVASGALALLFPQVPGIFAGGAVIWALYWRRQEAAVTGVEDRDGVRFFVEGTKAWEPIRLVRTPGFKATMFELESSPQEAATPRG